MGDQDETEKAVELWKEAIFGKEIETITIDPSCVYIKASKPIKFITLSFKVGKTGISYREVVGKL